MLGIKDSISKVLKLTQRLDVLISSYEYYLLLDIRVGICQVVSWSELSEIS